ncbi:MAG TPA: hypothetical protein VHY34_12130 [Caulobacteraceae bacterium]|nr:hypothetical protein [Caulobacteraceae bacterium]
MRFLQNAVDRAYEEGVTKYNTGRLKTRLSREEAIGNEVDAVVRRELRELFIEYQIRYGAGENIRINNRDYSTSEDGNSYKIPDARVGNASFDWTLTLKTISSAQIRGFFSADARPEAVVIVRPSQLGQNSTYLIPRPSNIMPQR